MIRAITWNLFHGRDHPPAPELLTWRSRLTRRPESNATHLQVNADLLDYFARVIADAQWDVALLQECPPRFAGRLASAARAASHRALTSRNWLLPLTQRLARWNPDLIASWEGGSNLTLVRGQPIAERRAVVLARFPERRVMALTRLETGLCVANLHASGAPARAEEEVRKAAHAATAFAAGAPLVFGGDLNLRPASSGLFAELERAGMSPPSDDQSIDHLLALGGEVIAPPAPWPAERREIAMGGRAIRLSDHSPVEGAFEFPAAAHADLAIG